MMVKMANTQTALRTALLCAAHEFSDYLPEPLEPGDCDELMHIMEPVVMGLLTDSQARCKQLEEAAEMLWIAVANVSGSDWTTQTPEWQDAAARFRDLYLSTLTPTERPPS
jgi:hypothetical protein